MQFINLVAAVSQETMSLVDYDPSCLNKTDVVTLEAIEHLLEKGCTEYCNKYPHLTSEFRSLVSGMLGYRFSTKNVKAPTIKQLSNWIPIFGKYNKKRALAFAYKLLLDLLHLNHKIVFNLYKFIITVVKKYKIVKKITPTFEFLQFVVENSLELLDCFHEQTPQVLYDHGADYMFTLYPLNTIYEVDCLVYKIKRSRVDLSKYKFTVLTKTFVTLIDYPNIVEIFYTHLPVYSMAKIAAHKGRYNIWIDLRRYYFIPNLQHAVNVNNLHLWQTLRQIVTITHYRGLKLGMYGAFEEMLSLMSVDKVFERLVIWRELALLQKYMPRYCPTATQIHQILCRDCQEIARWYLKRCPQIAGELFIKYSDGILHPIFKVGQFCKIPPIIHKITAQNLIMFEKSEMQEYGINLIKKLFPDF